jgi:hypothetical protein
MSVARGARARWRARRRDSNGSGPDGARAVAGAPPVVLSAAPGRRRRLSEGVLLEASVLGRVLGVRILTLRATVLLAPASVTAAASADRDLPGRVDARRPRAAPARRRAAGRELAEAVRRIDEGTELLAEARRRAV